MKNYILSRFMNKSRKVIPQKLTVNNKSDLDTILLQIDKDTKKNTTSYKGTPRKHYYYLDDDELHKEFSLDRDVNKSHTLHLLFYKMNYVLETPFLEFYLEKNTTEYELPKMSFTFSQEDLKKDIEDAFLDKCFDFCKQKINIQIESIPFIYKGFVEYNEDIVAVFDCTDEDVLNIKDPTVLQRWAILNEIMIKKSIQSIPISENIVQLFLVNKILQNIKNINGENIVLPNLVYICKKNGNSYENDYYKDDKNDFNQKHIIQEHINDPSNGIIFLFSKEPITTMFLSKIKRFVLFINEKEISQHHLYKMNDPTINKEVWYVKTPKYFYQL